MGKLNGNLPPLRYSYQMSQSGSWLGFDSGTGESKDCYLANLPGSLKGHSLIIDWWVSFSIPENKIERR